LIETRAIGAGPKILDKSQPSITTEFRKHPEYWGGDPFIDRWHLPLVPEYSNAYAQFTQGNIIDFAPTAQDVFLLRKDAPNTVIVASEISQTTTNRQKFGKLNIANAPWQDERVRIAVRRQVDYPGIAAVVSNKAEFEANGIPIEISPSTHVMHNPSYWLNPDKGELGEFSKNYAFDIAEAKKLVAAAGYNEPIPLTYFFNSSNSGATAQRQELIQDFFKQSGLFRLELSGVPSSSYNELITVSQQFDGIQQESGPNGDEIDYILFRDYHKSQRNGATFPDAKMDEYAEATRRETDFNKRVALIKEIQLYAAQKMYYPTGSSLYTTFSFRWPWLHNATQRAHLHWLDESMPKRNG
jgi:ABC-type transport system substrate-binding protein